MEEAMLLHRHSCSFTQTTHW